jgi:hypothetical protein
MLASWRRPLAAALLAVVSLALGGSAHAQNANSTSINGVVEDPTGAVIPGATVEIQNPASGTAQTAKTDNAGNFTLPNVPFGSYHMTATAEGFASYAQDVAVQSAAPLNLTIAMQLPQAAQSVTVEAAPAGPAETTPTFQTNIDRGLIEKVPLESATSSVSSLVTEASPGVTADSNGLFHGLGDHAENSFSVDGQPITDQQSKVFSNQIPLDSIQSMQVIAGAPPAEYGDKTSVVIDVTTRSGLGVTPPHGSVTAEYGSFGTSNLGFDLSDGGKKWGNFLSASGLNTGRFLDTPEFAVMHDKGNEENIFDRLDYQFNDNDTIHTNLQFTRSWFQNPNSFDQQTHLVSYQPINNGAPTRLTNPLTGAPLGPTDQRSQIRTFNVAPSWTHLLDDSSLFTFGAFVRHDEYQYFPSGDPFADYSPDLQSESIGQFRTLTNAGARASFSYAKGMHNVKAGADYEQTYLTERDSFGIVDPLFLASLPSNQQTALAPYDLTIGGQPYTFNGHTDVKELALYAQDAITKGNWNFNLGIRGDLYNGLSVARQAEPRVGGAYNIKKTNTVLRASYARLLETPFNENLVLSSVGCANPVLNPLLSCASSTLTPLTPGTRNEFHAGLQQSLGKHLVASAEYIWKYTHNAYDFSIFSNTPITFPIEWRKSKITGVAGRVDFTSYHGVSAYTVFSSVAARFFQPQLGGAGASPSVGIPVFRIDHDEAFNQTTHVQYQPWKRGPWLGFNWHFDSGMVAGRVPCAGGQDCPNGPLGSNSVVDVSNLTADQQFQAGLFCGSVSATPTTPISSGLGPNLCPAGQYGSKLTRIPAPGTENDDKNPPRIAPRNLFDVTVGQENIFRKERFKTDLDLTAVNVTNEYALYNFLSTFSGTHYVTPRALTAKVTFNF